jgi:CheY-like chemotaxis protein
VHIYAYLGNIAIEKVGLKMSYDGGNRTLFDAILMDFVMPNMNGPTGKN